MTANVAAFVFVPYRRAMFACVGFGALIPYMFANPMLRLYVALQQFGQRLQFWRMCGTLGFQRRPLKITQRKPLNALPILRLRKSKRVNSQFDQCASMYAFQCADLCELLERDIEPKHWVSKHIRAPKPTQANIAAIWHENKAATLAVIRFPVLCGRAHLTIIC